MEWEAGSEPAPSPCFCIAHGHGMKCPRKRPDMTPLYKNPSFNEMKKATAADDRAGAGSPCGREQHRLRQAKPRPAKVKPVLLGSLVVDVEGMEDVQEGGYEGKELHERKESKSWGQLRESNPISSQCSRPGDTSQPRAPSSLAAEAKPHRVLRRQPCKAVSCCTLRSLLWLHAQRQGAEAVTSVMLLRLSRLCCGFKTGFVTSSRRTAWGVQGRLTDAALLSW